MIDPVKTSNLFVAVLLLGLSAGPGAEAAVEPRWSALLATFQAPDREAAIQAEAELAYELGAIAARRHDPAVQALLATLAAAQPRAFMPHPESASFQVPRYDVPVRAQGWLNRLRAEQVATAILAVTDTDALAPLAGETEATISAAALMAMGRVKGSERARLIDQWVAALADYPALSAAILSVIDRELDPAQLDVLLLHAEPARLLRWLPRTLARLDAKARLHAVSVAAARPEIASGVLLTVAENLAEDPELTRWMVAQLGEGHGDAAALSLARSAVDLDAALATAKLARGKRATHAYLALQWRQAGR